jgi:hypothetical protein
MHTNKSFVFNRLSSAGEAEMAFALVADEVGNLARRSAQVAGDAPNRWLQRRGA